MILLDRTDRVAASVTKVSTVFLRHAHYSPRFELVTDGARARRAGERHTTAVARRHAEIYARLIP